MSKKKFSAGLDDLFTYAAEDESEVLTAAGEEAAATTMAARPAERRHAHKNFALGLDQLLQEALEESLERYDANQPDTVTAASKTKSAQARPGFHASPTGLDALIRQTIDVQEISHDEQTGKRRLTVAVDKSKVEQLKVIARLENAYMKDLLVNLIDGYIEEYSRQKGLSN